MVSRKQANRPAFSFFNRGGLLRVSSLAVLLGRLPRGDSGNSKLRLLASSSFRIRFLGPNTAPVAKATRPVPPRFHTINFKTTLCSVKR
jgi:hypothetical protein